MSAKTLWLDALPNDWAVGRIKDHVTLVNGFPFDSQSFNRSIGTRLVRIRDLTDGGDVTYVDADVPVMINSGDLVVGMDGDFNVVTWKGGAAALNQRLCVLRARPSLDQRFLGYILPMPLKAINDVTYFTTVKHLSSSDLLAERIPLPPVPTQRAIADYLDRETARIDALDIAKQRMIALLEERERETIHHLITRIDAERPPLRWFAVVGSGDSLASTNIGPEGPTPVYGGNGIMGYTSRSPLTRELSIAVGRVGALCGNVHVVAEPAWITDNALWIRRLRGLDPRFLALVLRAAKLNDLADKTAQPLITGETVKSTRVPLIPMAAQREVVLTAARSASLTTAVTRSLREQLALLREHRQALITAAVTGEVLDITPQRLDIPDAA